MGSRAVTVGSTSGLHARPAALFVEAASETGLDVEIGRPGEDAVDATRVVQPAALNFASVMRCDSST